MAEQNSDKSDTPYVPVHMSVHVAVLGLGYVGLPTAAVFASRGIQVTGVDINPATVDTINNGEVHIVEPELDIMVKAAVATGFLKAAVSPTPADAFIIAVPTPIHHDTNAPDLSYVEAAAKSIAPVLKAGNLVIVESTSPVGTTEKCAHWMAEARPDLTFPIDGVMEPNIHVAHSPERVLPGKVLHELVANDRIVGGLSPTCAERAKELYKRVVGGTCHITDARTAELVKLMENAYRDTNIAFANEMSMICDAQGINPWKAIELANRHPRVNILNPGPGVGGHCIAVDPWFIVAGNPDLAQLIKTARQVNDAKPKAVVEKVLAAVEASPGPVACLGLAYKADIDDLRESPSVDVVRMIADRTTQPVLVVEPHVADLPEDLADRGADIDNLSLVPLETALGQAETVVLLTDHEAFRTMDLSLLSGKQVIDTRGSWPAG